MSQNDVEKRRMAYYGIIISCDRLFCFGTILISNLTARVLKCKQHILKEENMAVKLQPLADRVVLKPIAREEVTKSGIVLPDTAKEKPQEGQIIAVGPGKIDEAGKRVPMDVKVGDVVVYARYGGTEMKIEGEELVILREGDILAKKTK